MQWSIKGADGQPIIGNTHMPGDTPAGVIVIAHGFKGYKDYGMFPRITRECAARGGLIAHRFNFSHSGMTERLETFERPDLFERDTWSRQVFDATAVINAIARGELAGGSLPLFLLGHSRGGVTSLLAAEHLTYPGTFSEDDGGATPSDPRESAVPNVRSAHGRTAEPLRGLAVAPGAHVNLAGIITLAAPSSCNPLTPEEQELMLKQGWLESPSSRTGQRLRIGREFLQEQLDEPAGHDLLAHVQRIRCPILIIHGEADPTVPLSAAHDLARAAGDRATLHVVRGGDHVFNTPNPLPESEPSSPQLTEAIDTVIKFTTAITQNAQRATERK